MHPLTCAAILASLRLTTVRGAHITGAICGESTSAVVTTGPWVVAAALSPPLAAAIMANISPARCFLHRTIVS
jgi:hypothetical protein